MPVDPSPYPKGGVMEIKSIVIKNHDYEIQYEISNIYTHTERHGRIGMRHTVVDRYDIDLIAINDLDPSHFSEMFRGMVDEELRTYTDEEVSERMMFDHVPEEWDRRYDERKEAING